MSAATRRLVADEKWLANGSDTLRRRRQRRCARLAATLQLVHTWEHAIGAPVLGATRGGPGSHARCKGRVEPLAANLARQAHQLAGVPTMSSPDTSSTPTPPAGADPRQELGIALSSAALGVLRNNQSSRSVSGCCTRFQPRCNCSHKAALPLSECAMSAVH
eukprot:356500-Chlamydomonas_euryale.AAC.3